MKKQCIYLLIFVFLGLGGCASHQSQSDLTEDGFESDQENIDRFEGFNRAMFAFNMKLDSWVLKPVAKGYDKVTPGFVKTGVSNFFDNIGEVGNILNNILQWKWKQAGNDSGRLLINSTVGLFGLFDIASPIGLKESDGEDFGQTLSKWGVKRGPYLVLPLFGPSTLRDGVAKPFDYFMDPVSYAEGQATQNWLTATRLVDVRYGLLEAEELVSGDKYLFFRDAYLQRREYLINDGELKIDFSDDEDF